MEIDLFVLVDVSRGCILWDTEGTLEVIDDDLEIARLVQVADARARKKVKKHRQLTKNIVVLKPSKWATPNRKKRTEHDFLHLWGDGPLSCLCSKASSTFYNLLNLFELNLDLPRL
jgi:hypothetical protein